MIKNRYMIHHCCRYPWIWMLFCRFFFNSHDFFNIDKKNLTVCINKNNNQIIEKIKLIFIFKISLLYYPDKNIWKKIIIKLAIFNPV